MNFNKLILGEAELKEFECLLLREKYINSFWDSSYEGPDTIEDSYAYANTFRIKDKKRLLISLMLFEKIESTKPTQFNLSSLINAGVVDKDSCMNYGTPKEYATFQIISGMYDIYTKMTEEICNTIDGLFLKHHINLFSRGILLEEEMFLLCSCFFSKTKKEFFSDFQKYCSLALKRFIGNIPMDGSISIYAHSYNDSERLIRDPRFIRDAYSAINVLMNKLEGIQNWENWNQYKYFVNLLDDRNMKYTIPPQCKNCHRPWKSCLENSEFLYDTEFHCDIKETLGEQRFAKLNGLIMSQTEHGSLFDNSIKFNHTKKSFDKTFDTIDDIYHIVNVDMSHLIKSLPIPSSVSEALWFREQEEINSFREIFLKWSEYMYLGQIEAAEKIRKDIEKANRFLDKKYKSQRIQSSLFYCILAVLGGFIPILSNVQGIISPFINRKQILEEEACRWIILTKCSS